MSFARLFSPIERRREPGWPVRSALDEFEGAEAPGNGIPGTDADPSGAMAVGREGSTSSTRVLRGPDAALADVVREIEVEV